MGRSETTSTQIAAGQARTERHIGISTGIFVVRRTLCARLHCACGRIDDRFDEETVNNVSRVGRRVHELIFLTKSSEPLPSDLDEAYSNALCDLVKKQRWTKGIEKRSRARRVRFFLLFFFRQNFNHLTTSEQARLPAEFKHIIKRRKRN